MTLQDKFDAALAILAEHNAAVGGVGKPGYVNPDDFLDNLKAIGATSEDRLKLLNHEDILEIFPGDGIKPKILVKALSKVFRDNVPVGESAPIQYGNAEGTPRPVSAKKASQMTPRELVQSFDPEDATGPVGTRLNQMAKGHAFIVYESGRTIDVESSFKLLQEIKQGFTGRKDFEVNGVIKPVFKVGELPNNFADENPLYIGRPLRPDGTCDQTSRSWEGVPLEVRQLVRLATQGKNVSFDDAHKFLDFAHGVEPMSTLRKRYRDASLEFDSLAATGNLPTLKIALGVEGGKGNSPRPFGEGKKVVWEKAPEAFANYYVQKPWKK